MPKFGDSFGQKLKVNENEGRYQQKQRIGEKVAIHCWAITETIFSNTLISSLEISLLQKPASIMLVIMCLGHQSKGDKTRSADIGTSNSVR